MPRFNKPAPSKKTVPFQREVPPPSPSAGTPSGVSPMAIRQTISNKAAGDVGFGTIAEYAKSLEMPKSKGIDRRAALEKLLVGSPELSKALQSQPSASFGGRDPLSASLAPIMNTIAGGGEKLSQLSKTNIGELLAAGGVGRTIQGKGSIMDILNVPLTYTGSMQAVGAMGKFPKGIIPKVLQAAGLYGAGSINPETRKILQKYVGKPISKVWDVANTPIADLLP